MDTPERNPVLERQMLITTTRIKCERLLEWFGEIPETESNIAGLLMRAKYLFNQPLSFTAKAVLPDKTYAVNIYSPKSEPSQAKFLAVKVPDYQGTLYLSRSEAIILQGDQSTIHPATLEEIRPYSDVVSQLRQQFPFRP